MAWHVQQCGGAQHAKYFSVEQHSPQNNLHSGMADQSINQSIYFANWATTKNECQQNNVKHSDGLPEKQIAHLSLSPK